MSKKIVKKRKLKLGNLLLVLLFIVGLFFCVYEISIIKVKNIIVENTNYLNDDMVLELAEVKDYPKFFLTSSSAVAKKLKKSDYIKDAKMIKKYPLTFVIKIEEKKPLFFDVSKEKYIFDNGDSVLEDNISREFRVPRLLNYVPDNKYKKYLSGMNNIKGEVLYKISEIEYQPNDYDKDRFLLYMDDGNMVYLTLTKFKMINHYNDVLTQLDNHKGILYLDNGNHFKIME